MGEMGNLFSWIRNPMGLCSLIPSSKAAHPDDMALMFSEVQENLMTQNQTMKMMTIGNELPEIEMPSNALDVKLAQFQSRSLSLESKSIRPK
jgi:hypothetical protein